MQSVTRIYNYYKKFGYKTQVMGASFRKVEQIVDLAGCDLLTISPDLLDALQKAPGEITPRLTLEARAGVGGREDHARREDLSLDAQPGSDGGREAVGRHPPLQRRRPQARAVGGHAQSRLRDVTRSARPDSPLRATRGRSADAGRAAALVRLHVLPRSDGRCRRARSTRSATAGASVAFVHGASPTRPRRGSRSTASTT